MGRERVAEELPKPRAKVGLPAQEPDGADHGSLLAGVAGGDGTHVHPTSVLRLQRLAGNAAVGELVGGQDLAVQRDDDEDSSWFGGDDSANDSSSSYDDSGADAAGGAGAGGEVGDDGGSSTDDSTTDDSTTDDGSTDDSATDDGSTSSGLIVEDDATPGDGQMTKSDFLARVRAAVIDQVDGASDLLVAPYFLTYQYSDAADVEARIKSEAPAASGATTAAGLIPAIVDQVNARVGAADSVDTEAGSSDDGSSSLADTVMGKAKPGESGPSGSAPGIRTQLGGGRPLDASVRSRMQSALGADLTGVRIHTDPSAASLADREGARAFTVGEHVAFGPGEYQPDSPVGDALLAHELAHVAQQRGGDTGAPQTAADESALEDDADSAAVSAVASRWALGQEHLSSIAHGAGARLRSGLRLQRCSNKQVEGTAKEAQDIKDKLDEADKVASYGGMLLPDSKIGKLNQLRGYLQKGSGILGQGLSAKAFTDEMVALATAIDECNAAQAANDRVAMAKAMDHLFVAAGNLMVRVPALATVGQFLQGTGTFFEDVGHSAGGMGPAQDQLDEINRDPTMPHVGPR